MMLALLCLGQFTYGEPEPPKFADRAAAVESWSYRIAAAEAKAAEVKTSEVKAAVALAPKPIPPPLAVAPPHIHPQPVIAPAPAPVLRPAMRTTVCQCHGFNESVCLCRKSGVACHCSSAVGSVWNVTPDGRLAGKTGAKVHFLAQGRPASR